MSFGERLKTTRQQLSWSQEQLATQIGVKRSIVAYYESGRTYPSVPVLKRLAKVLQVSLDWLLFDEYETRGELQDKELVDYLAKLDQLERRDRALVKDFIDNVLARVKLDKLERADRKKRAA